MPCAFYCGQILRHYLGFMATKPYECLVDGVRLNVHLSPNASRTGIDRTDNVASGRARIRATVTAPPEKGKANKALISLLAKKLRLPKSSIQIIAGQQSRDKTVFFSGAPNRLQPLLEDLLKSIGA